MRAMKALMLVIALTGTSLYAAENQYVKDMDGKAYFPIGVTYAWKNWAWISRIRAGPSASRRSRRTST